MVQPPMGGGDVEELIEDIDGPLPLEQALQIANQTAQGLVFAHSKGIIYRDLSPETSGSMMMVTPRSATSVSQ